MAQAELNMEDYLAMARRRLKVILVPLLIGPIAGYLISYVFSPRYTSQSMVLVQGQKVPTNYVTPVITADFTQRIATLQQEILSTSRLRPAIQSLGVVKPEEEAELMSDIRSNMTVTPLLTSISIAASANGAKKPTPANAAPLPGFSIGYSDKNPVRAQRICAALTDLMLNENLKSRAEVAKSTTDFLGRQVEDAKRALDEQDEKLSAFKKAHMGELPTDLDTNVRMLAALTQQLDSTTQTLSRAQQDKNYAETTLAQQLAAWKSSQSSASPQVLQQQLATLQTQLMQLQARYTEDYPDVIKTKSDIANVQARLDELNKQAANPVSGTPDKVSVDEPGEIKTLRLQVHQYQAQIDQSTSDQKKLQAAINKYQGLTAMSPAIEEQWRVLTRDYDTAQQFYRDLLAKNYSSNEATNMENAQEGEQMIVNSPASLPSDASFPQRELLAAGGLGAGLGLGVLIAIFLEFSDRSIRTEKDIVMSMDLPMLISVPWLGEEETSVNGKGRRFWGAKEPSPRDREKVGV